jgi:hypothetical protein
MEWIWLLRAFSFLVGAATVGAGLATARRLRHREETDESEELPPGTHMPGIAFELARSPGEAAVLIRLLGGPDAIRQNLRRDDRYVIPVYVVLLVLLGVWLATRDLVYALPAGLGVAVAGLLAGFADRRENRKTEAVLAEHEKDPTRELIPEPAVDAMRRASMAKWGLLAVAMALLSLPFLEGERHPLTGGFYLLSAVSYGLGLQGLRVGMRRLVEWGFYLMGLAWLATPFALSLVPG